MSDLILKCGPRVNGHQTIEALLNDRVVARDSVDLASTNSRDQFVAMICKALPGVDRGAIDRELMNIKPIPGDGWDDPVAVDLPLLPSIPIDGLPDVLRDWIVATSEATQTPVELAALLSLAACSGMVARRIVIEPRAGWIEPINLFVVVLLDPANRKSSVLKSAFDPIRKIEAELIEAARPEIAVAQSNRRILESQLKGSEKKCAAGDSKAVADAKRLAAQLAQEAEPVAPKLLLDDASPEAVEMNLAAQGGRLIAAGAEGGLFDVMGGRYSGSVNLDVFLKSHAGDDLRVDRVVRGSVAIDRVCLTLAYAIQPDVIRGLAGKPSFRGRGLLGRFLYALPPSPLGHRKIIPDPVPDKVANEYENLIRRLHGLIESDDHVHRLKLSAAAAERFDQWQSEVEPWLADEGPLVGLTDWGGKLCGLTARLAAVIHLARWVGDHVNPVRTKVEVEVDSIEAAVAIARWAIAHARASIGLMAGDDGSVLDADAILKWLKKQESAQVSRRNIGQQFRSRFDRDEKRLDRALDVLMDRGWLRPVDDQSVRAGRPSLRFDCHPWIANPPRVSGLL
ncbi:MAG: DUF3987 domain-containing protein [Planctomycetaceae bacterium]|nr:DUF3987 domain-containing protein [Planctomycetaceae bacterium]